MAIDKHQCIARLDKTELDKLDIVAQSAGLSRSGAIRRLIRDFNIQADDVKPANKFIVDRQISKDIFLQLPTADIGAVTLQKNFADMSCEIWFSSSRESKAFVIGYVNHSLTRLIDGWDYSILYSLSGVLYRQNCAIDETWGTIADPSHGHSQSTDRLNQIFVV
jgi:hypothetical protein